MSYAIATASGTFFDPFDTDPATINVTDIAVGLSNTPRFRGHSYEFYSVAQHSCNVAQLVLHAVSSPFHALAGLMHDAAEAYLGDVPEPYKRHPAYAEVVKIESQLLVHIFFAVGLTWPMDKVVHWADEVLLHCEARMLLPNATWAREEPVPEVVDLLPWDPPQARQAFLSMFYRLKGAVIAAHQGVLQKVGRQS